MNKQGQRNSTLANAHARMQTLLQSHVDGEPVSVYELAYAAEDQCHQSDFIDLLDIAAQEISACGKSACWQPIATGGKKT
jgi:hypothetical protein